MISLSVADEFETLIPIFRDALPYEDRLRHELASPDLTVYSAWNGDEFVGAVAVRWEAPSEIAILAVARDMRGRGNGRRSFPPFSKRLAAVGSTECLWPRPASLRPISSSIRSAGFE